MHFRLFMFFYCCFIRAWAFILNRSYVPETLLFPPFWGNRQCCLMVSLFKLMHCATSCPVSVRYILNITPHIIVFRSFSHQTAVDNLVEKHER